MTSGSTEQQATLVIIYIVFRIWNCYRNPLAFWVNACMLQQKESRLELTLEFANARRRLYNNWHFLRTACGWTTRKDFLDQERSVKLHILSFCDRLRSIPSINLPSSDRVRRIAYPAFDFVRSTLIPICTLSAWLFYCEIIEHWALLPWILWNKLICVRSFFAKPYYCTNLIQQLTKLQSTH
jgi:hypothetical protein